MLMSNKKMHWSVGNGEKLGILLIAGVWCVWYTPSLPGCPPTGS